MKPLDDVLETISIENEVNRLMGIAKRLDRSIEWQSKWRSIFTAKVEQLSYRRRFLLDNLL